MRKLFTQYLPNLLRKIAIRQRLFASFILLSLLPLLASGYISYVESSKAIQQKTRLFSTEIVKQVAKNIQLRMAEIEAGSETLVLSDPVQSALARYARDNPVEQGQARAELTKILLSSYGSFTDFGQKYFLDRNQHILDPQVFAQLSHGVAEFSSVAQSSKSSPYWGTLELWDGQKSIAMVRQIYFKSDNTLAGRLFLGIRSTRFSSIFDNVNLGAGSEIFVVDTRDGSALIQNRDHLGVAVSSKLLQQIDASVRSGQQTGFLAYRDTSAGRAPTDFFAAFTQVPRTSWYVVSTLPNDLLLGEAQAVRNEIVLIGLVCFVCAILLAYAIARSISMPLEKLA